MTVFTMAASLQVSSIPLCYQGCCPRIIPLSLPRIDTSYSYLSFRRKLQREKNKNWLEPTRPKMVEDLTSNTPWFSLDTHYNTLACQVTQPPAPWQLTTAMTTSRKAHTRTEKESCISSKSKPHLCFQIIHEYSSHSFQFPPFYLDPPTHLVPLPKLGWEVDLWTRFPLLHSLTIE